MPDVDKFEPLARQWKPILDRYIKEQDSTSAQLADDILTMTIMMLKYCGGCRLLPQLADLLWQYRYDIIKQTLSVDAKQKYSFRIEQELDKIVQQAIHQRIEMITIRSTCTAAIAIQTGVLDTENHQILQEKLGIQIVQDLIRHCCLDTARAHSIGTRFANGDEAYQFYTDVMTTLRPGIRHIAQQLVLYPNGETLSIPSSSPPRARKDIVGLV